MNKRTVLVTILCLITIALVIGGIYYIQSKESKDVSSYYINGVKPLTSKSENFENDKVSKANKRNQAAIKKRGTIKHGIYENFVFVGDSRYRGMDFMAKPNDTFICESGRGFDYLSEQMTNIQYACSHPNTALIIGLGVNDKGGNAQNYIDTLGNMAETLDCTIYYMLVNPVDEDVEAKYGYDVTNASIDSFNETMINNLDRKIGIIDTNSYLWDIGFQTQDGLHYTNETYEAIYNYIKDSLSNKS
ncbi:MAG: hypothetical protein K6G88_05310 [Lachnospiraceae bacterium]|nr:hypothetical protein [Lachnospiraceae bacterium]